MTDGGPGSGDRAPRHPRTFWALVEQRASRTPDAVAFEDERGRRLTFDGYRAAAEAVAAGLYDNGVRPGSIVSWQLPTAIDTQVLLAALTRLGAVQNPIIPIFREREVRYITREARSDFFLVRPAWRGFDFAAFASKIADEVGFSVLAVEELPRADSSLLPDPPDSGEVPRWLYYTSGSTSDPKGAWHTDASVLAGMNAFVAKVRPTEADLMPIAFPIAHIGGVCMLGAALTCGFAKMLVEAFYPERTPLVMAERSPTILGSALPFFNAYLAAQHAHGPEPLFPKLRVCVNGGAPKPTGLHDEVRRDLGGRGVLGSWGLTEFPVATSGGIDDTDEQIAATEGTAAPGVEIRVVGPDGLEKAPGEEGELRLRGPQMFQGYADPSLDAAAFDERGFFCTGDLGVVAATGHVTITGRVKDVIIRNAENVSAGEIEDLLHGHPAIHDVAVIGVRDARTGERVCAVVELVGNGSSLTLAEVADFCRGRGLAAYKIPERLELVTEMPRNAMGKLDKPVLRSRYAT